MGDLMVTNARGKDVTIAVLATLCLLLAVVTTWALLTRGEGKGHLSPAAAVEYWVAPDGNDGATGTRDSPWATLQHAVDQAGPDTTVYVRGGTYPQQVTFSTSGEPGHPLVLTAAPGELPVLDGSGLNVPAGQSGMVEINGQHDLVVSDLAITGYRSDANGHVPIGVFVTGAADDVRLEGLDIHDLGTTFPGRNGGDAHGIAVYGTSAAEPISGLVVLGNELHDLTLGSSEALVVNGNVKDFVIEGNEVHDTNNIGIDVIGFEGTAPDPTIDQARDGIVRGNQVWNIDSRGNPAYGNDRSADGIYVDGGRDVLVEGNTIHDVNIGIELASEHAGRATRNITVRNNLVHDTTTIGLAIGGYDRRRGSTESCTLVNNTVVRSVGPVLLVQFDTRDNVIENNILVAGPSHSFVENPYRENVRNTLDHNLYWTADDTSVGTWQWKGRGYPDFDRWVAGSGNDRHSSFGNPQFANPSGGDFSLRSGSAAVDRGVRLAEAGGADLAGEPRAQGASPDVGAYEAAAPKPTPTPQISGTAVFVGDLNWLVARNGWGPPEVDRSNGERAPDDGRRLRIGSASFAQGIGVHAPSRIVVEPPPGCSLFLADVGLDEEVGDKGSVVFAVWGDGVRLVSSTLLRGADRAMPLVTDVTGVRRLALVVDAGGDGNANDHADWGDPRLDCSSG